MKFITKRLKRFQKDEDGAALVEYAVTLLVVIIVGSAAIISLGNSSSTLFGNASGQMSKAASCSAGATCSG